MLSLCSKICENLRQKQKQSNRKTINVVRMSGALTRQAGCSREWHAAQKQCPVIGSGSGVRPGANFTAASILKPVRCVACGNTLNISPILALIVSRTNENSPQQRSPTMLAHCCIPSSTSSEPLDSATATFR